VYLVHWDDTGVVGQRTRLIGVSTGLVSTPTGLVGVGTDLVRQQAHLPGIAHLSVDHLRIHQHNMVTQGSSPANHPTLQEEYIMPGKPYPLNTFSQARSVLSAWTQIDDQLTFGALNISRLTSVINQARDVDEQIIHLKNQLTNLRNQRDATYHSLWDAVKRVRAGVKGNFGDDSSQYEMVGGTRLSERKTARRTATPASEA
jgi:hypothetical protein